MKKKFTFQIFICLITGVQAQSNHEQTPFYIDVYINADEEIRIERDLISFSDIGNSIDQIIRNHPFKRDTSIVYRIFADGNLQLGIINDVEQQMLAAYGYQVKRERYLLQVIRKELDGPNWLEKLEGKKIYLR
ncbi:hypothetical protein OA501_01145 [Flavobacteriaceae bacterium]|nr:hypothetical protein [Flavobacteriaceae bacterium]